MSMGNVLLPRDRLPILGIGSSSLRVLRWVAIPLPLRGRVCVHPVFKPYPNGAESLRARKPFLTPLSIVVEDARAPVRCRFEPRRDGSSPNSMGPGDGGSGVERAVSYRVESSLARP